MSAEPINPNQPSQPKIRPRSKILQHPSSTSITRISQPTTPKRLTASLNPKDFIHEFDLITELSENKELYSGDEWITLYSFPSYLYTCLERFKTDYKNTTKSKVGMSSIISCCISNGLSILSQESAVKDIIKLKDKLFSLHTSLVEEFEEISTWLGSFPLSHITTTSGSKRRSFTVPQHTKAALGDMASNLGISSSSLAVLCISHTLSNEPSMLEGRKKDLTLTMAQFIRRAKIRKVFVESLLEVFKEEKRYEGGEEDGF